MILCDVNVFIRAHKEGTDQHEHFAKWLTEALEGDETFGVSEHVLSAFVRIVTNRRAFDPPSSFDDALTFADQLRDHGNALLVSPGPREAGAKGNLIPDAYFAASAIESGSTWITTDRDFARFPGLRWRHPLAQR